MKIIVNPCSKIELWGNHETEVPVFCKIELLEGKLSITGVVGPKSNGNCYGSCGQCSDEVRTGTPTKNWTDEMLQKFCDIWDEWHLNDMRPYCKHMKKMGWDKLASEKVEIKTYRLTSEALKKQKEAKKRALESFKTMRGFFPTPDECMYYNLPYEVKTYNNSPLLHAECYEFKEKDCLGYSNIDHKTRGWIDYSENELGLLGRECPVCGYKYGHNWLTEEIPQDIIDFLTNLPKSTKVPAWI